jgi:glutamate-1-semialdehyde 2,1-aminomutase
MYGSDDIPIGIARGKYITFGRAWAFLSESNHKLSMEHCDDRMSFTRYEQLRAMRRAALRTRLTPQQIEGLFFSTAQRLVSSTKSHFVAELVRVPNG